MDSWRFTAPPGGLRARARSPIILWAVFLIGLTWLPALAANDVVSPLKARRYTIDPFRSYLTFSIGFLKIKTTEGTFHEYTGTIMYDPKDLAASSVTAVLEAESIFTGVRARDRHLRSSDFFEVETYPHIVFRSSRIEPQGGEWALHGDLTLHGTTRELAIRFRPEADSEAGGERLIFTGETRLSRRDFGVIGNFWANQVLSDEVSVELRIEAAPVEQGSFSPPLFAPHSLREPLLEPALRRDLAALRSGYRSLQAAAADRYDFSEAGLLELAVALKGQGELEAAADVLRFNLELFPEHSGSRDFLGYLQVIEGRTEEAVRIYRDLLERRPFDAGALEMLRWLEGGPGVAARY